ncbi:uncharacterized protein LOC112601856 [Melanaphis sacchari]|uniref:Transcription factor Adf-1 n=1 Tax=Melanaphis sacchari TaxID=742174 RepID=A0A2H8TTE6_9HEMI|nr:uncharacterized protein LOC112601856 [Melanaphis sacchari]
MPSPASTPSAQSRRRRRRDHHNPQNQLQSYHSGHRGAVVSLPADTTTTSLSPVALATAAAVASNASTTASSTASVMAAAMAIANETNIDLIMINKIKQHQVLYDTDEDQYKYIDKRDKAWKEVADELGMPVNDVKLRWKRLRDNFRVSIKRTKGLNLKPGLPFVEGKPWKYQREMEFLLPFMQIGGYSLKKMLNLEHSPNQDYSSVYDDCKTEGSSSPYNNMSYEYDEMPEPRVEVKEMAGNYSNDEGGVDDELLYPDVEILSNGKHEPLHRVAKRVKRSAEAAAAAAAKEADSSAQLKLNQHHMNHYYHIQQQQHSHAKVHPVDLFFYSMAETTKGLPQAYQAEIKRRVLEIVIKAEEEMNKNKNYE